MIDVLTSASQSLNVDIAIYGAGPAGITLALELATGGRRVALFEGGGRKRSSLSQRRYKGEVTTGEGFHYPELDQFRLRYLGGTTNHWGGWCRPLERNVFGERDWLGQTAWPFGLDEKSTEIQRAQEWCEIGRVEYDADELCRSAGLQRPLPESETMTTPAWRFSNPTRFGERYRPHLRRSGIEVYLDANVVGFSVRGGRVDRTRLVDGDGVTHTVAAEHHVLTVGAIETARLLLLAEAEHGVGLDRSGWLGRGFQEHPHFSAGAIVVPTPMLAPDGPLAALLRPWPDGTDETPFRLGLALRPEVLRERGLVNQSFTIDGMPKASLATIPHATATVALAAACADESAEIFRIKARTEQRVQRASRVVLIDKRDDLGLRRARLDWRVEARDLADVRVGLGLVLRELQRSGAGPGFEVERPSITGGGHHLGGARMHDDPELGVVDADGRCHALPNLLVTGGAVFPSSCFSNPTLTIVALAVRLADRLTTGM